MGWPRSYLGKFVLVATLSFGLPLVAVIVVALLLPDLSLALELTLFAVALLSGGLLARWAFASLLQPLLAALSGLEIYARNKRLPELPAGYRDEAGRLLRECTALLHRLHEARTLLEQHGNYDPVTGLYSRPMAEELLERSLRLARRQAHPLSLALFDIDNFKQLNDRYGPSTGDEVLSRVARAVRAQLRGSDWAARWGGDEFLLVLATDREGGLEALARLRKAVKESVGEYGVTISAGLIRTDVLPAPEQLERLERALRQAKRGGRDRLVAG